MAVADEVCSGRLVAVHEGGYSEVHVPFCGHAVIQKLCGSAISAGDPLGKRIMGQQPEPPLQMFLNEMVDDMVSFFEDSPCPLASNGQKGPIG